jgi:hypothetical protein
LRALVLAQWPILELLGSSPLTIEGAIASVLGVIQTHILTGRPGPLIGLLGPLTGLVAAQYLPPPLVAREVQRGEELTRACLPSQPSTVLPSGAISPLLSNPNAHRARRCVLFLADHPQASNREIAAAVGVAHESQISKLLAGLLADGLLAKHSEGVGRRNSWQLTARGEEILRALRSGGNGPIGPGASAPGH